MSSLVASGKNACATGGTAVTVHGAPGEMEQGELCDVCCAEANALFGEQMDSFTAAAAGALSAILQETDSNLKAASPRLRLVVARLIVPELVMALVNVWIVPFRRRLPPRERRLLAMSEPVAHSGRVDGGKVGGISTSYAVAV